MKPAGQRTEPLLDLLDKVWGEIDAGVITTFEQVDHAAWPS